MTEKSPTESDGGGETDESGSEMSPDAAGTGSTGDRTTRVIGYVELGALGVLSLLGVVAVFGAYASALSAVDVWVADEYRPIFRTALNLVVLGLVGIGLSVLLRRRFDY